MRFRITCEWLFCAAPSRRAAFPAPLCDVTDRVPLSPPSPAPPSSSPSPTLLGAGCEAVSGVGAAADCDRRAGQGERAHHRTTPPAATADARCGAGSALGSVGGNAGMHQGPARQRLPPSAAPSPPPGPPQRGSYVSEVCGARRACVRPAGRSAASCSRRMWMRTSLSWVLGEPTPPRAPRNDAQRMPPSPFAVEVDIMQPLDPERAPK